MMDEIDANDDQINLGKTQTKREKSDFLSILKRKYVQKSQDNFVEQMHNENVISRINSLLQENENVIKSLENIPSLDETFSLKKREISKSSKKPMEFISKKL